VQRVNCTKHYQSRRECPILVGIILPPTEAHRVAGGEAYSPNPRNLSARFRGFAVLTPGYLVLPLRGKLEHPLKLDAPVFRLRVHHFALGWALL